MKRIVCLAGLLAAASCGVSEMPAPPDAPPSLPPAHTAAVDDGTYLARIDPLGGQWSIERLGDEDFRPFNGWINFSAGGFLNHGAGCAGGYPAFYRLDGPLIAITRREAIQVGKCAGASPAGRAASAASERRLAAFLDQLARWERSNDRTLILTAKDGTRALLTRPTEPQPDIAGRWIIETIGGQPLITERRPPTLSISMGSIGAFADCNSMGSQYTVPDPGRIVVTGPIVGTAIGCAPEDQAEDDLMARAIRSATGYRLEGERLILTGGPGMTARRPAEPDRRLAGEYKSCGNTLLGGYHEGPITLTIDERTIRDNADCVAEYVAEGPRLSLRLADGPACAAEATPFIPGEPVAVGGAISTIAVTRPDGFGFSDDGTLVLRTGRGLLTMCRTSAPPPFGD
jgi:heat shock protein HslJ